MCTTVVQSIVCLVISGHIWDIKNGVLCPLDLVTSNCHIMSQDKITLYYHYTFGLLIISLTMFMLKEIYTNLYAETSGLSVTSFSNSSLITVKVKKGTRDFNNVLMKGGNSRDNYLEQWKEDLDISFYFACWKNIFRNCFFLYKTMVSFGFSID